MFIGLGNMHGSTLSVKRILSAFRLAVYYNTKHGILRCKMWPFVL